MRLRSLVWAPSLLLVAACASSFEDGGASSPTCEPNPELSTQPKSIQANGQELNGQELNGQELNGQNLNGQELNGIQPNGSNLNGQNLNGVSLNGQSLNGQSLNGQNLNGQELNGTVLSGLAANEIYATTTDGAVVAGSALVGLKIAGVLSNGQTIELAISSFEREGDVAYYGLTYQGTSVCRDGEKGMFVSGVWDATAARHDRLTVGTTEISTSYSCASGAIAKCVGMGYAPWRAGADLHQTCTRMVRADYCGSGVSYTKNGTLIDVFDTRGIQTPTGDPSLSFEAGWGPNGAVCASRPRFDARTSAGDARLPACWSALPTCASLEEAVTHGATIGNASRPQSRVLCQ